jgi:hypothetical protein
VTDFNDKLCKITQEIFTCEFRAQETVKDTNDILETLELFFHNDFWRQCKRSTLMQSNSQ